MSSISTQIAAYRAGQITLQQLADYLTHYPYRVPDRYVDIPTDPADRELHSDAADRYVEGSWDEVDDASLTPEEFAIINRAAYENTHPAGSKPSRPTGLTRAEADLRNRRHEAFEASHGR